MYNSIRVRLTVAFIGLAIGPLLLVGMVLAWQSFTVQQQQALNSQRQVAQRVSTEVKAFFQELEDQLRIVSQVQGLQDLDLERQRTTLSELLSYQDVFEELALLDSQGQEKIHLSRLNPVVALGNRAESDEFILPQTNEQVYYSSIRFEESTGEPLITIAVPLFNIRTGGVDGVLVAEARIKKVWDLIAAVQVSPGQSVYIVDALGEVVAHRTPSVVLGGTTFQVPDQDGVQPGLTGSNTVLAVETIRFGQQEFNIVVEQIYSDALALAIDSMIVIGVVIAIALVIGSGLGFLIIRQIIRPIQAMAAAAQAISAGDLSQQVKFTGRDELGVLAKAFNSMTSQLRELIDSLEERVADRTQRLELVAILSERLTGILKVEELLQELVDQIKDEFGYYHAHVYLLDNARQNLVMTAGVGEAGAEMKARRHTISLNIPASLVARAARTREVVKVDNVREAADWLPNPLLPHTYSEMAVPIILEGEVVGVLDVQEDEIAGLDEGDANLLRSLANHVAVAIRNARQFTQVEMALAEAHAAQGRYLEQVWQKTRLSSLESQHLYKESDQVIVDEVQRQMFIKVRQEALTTSRPTLISLNDASSERKALVAPIYLGGKPIGDFQLHTANPGAWTEDDLAVIETVLDQLAQSAENLRLFDETRERASREQAIREITNKLRAAPNLDTLLETAARELGGRLGVQHTVLEMGIAPKQPVSTSGSNLKDNSNER